MHGLVYGSETFLKDLKDRYLRKRKMLKLPQHNRMYRDFDPERILGIVTKAMRIDVNELRNTKRISKTLRDQRDMLIYLLWESGRHT